MGPFRVVFLASSFLLFSLLLTWSTLRTPATARSSAFATGAGASQAAGFSFQTPSALFPPTAAISLTDDNSTFFVARTAAYGPELPETGLSGQIWLGSDFREDLLGGGHFSESSSGELGCDDALDWEPDEFPEQGMADGDDLLQDESEGTPRSRINNQWRHSAVKIKKGQDLHDSPRQVSRPSIKSKARRKLQRTVLTTFNLAGTTGATPHSGNIKSLQQSAEIAGKIVLLKRGGCGFLDKTRWVQDRGGKALIVGDNVPRGSLITMYAKGDISNITIPSIFTSHTTAHLLASLIADQGSGSNRTTNAGAHENLASIPVAYRNAEHETVAGATSEPSGLIKNLVKDLKKIREDDGTAIQREDGAGTQASTSDGFIIGVQDWRDPDMMNQENPDGATTSTREIVALPKLIASNHTAPLPHEGLWVTLTPTTVAFTPFFDTLLVLVVSPLITLTLVYLSLVLRNRLRQRRWRAPKAVVERLPVRTFSLQATESSHSSIVIDLTPSAPDSEPGVNVEGDQPAPTEETSLLQGESGIDAHAEPTEGTAEVDSPEEKARAAQRHQKTRRFRGRQLECVICLEEYVDGVSRVMRLPCGHEFHQACM